MMLEEENAIHSGCINAKAADAVGRGWKLEARGKEADPDKEDALREQLNDLCPEESFSELLSMAAEEEEILGWSAWEVLRTPPITGRISALYYLPANTLRISAVEEHQEEVWMQLVEGETRFFVEFGSGIMIDAVTGEMQLEQIEEPASEVLLFKRRSRRSPWYGTPKWISAVPAIAELTAIREFNVSFFASGGMADRHIHVTAGDITAADDIAKAIDETLREFSGRAHLTITTHGTPDTSIDVKPLSPTTGKREGQFIVRRQDLIKEVLTAHNMPPYRIGLAELGSLGGSAAREMMRAYRVGSIEPIQTRTENKLNKTLFNPKEGGLDLEGYRWVLNDIDYDETELDLKIATEGVTQPILTPNEARQVMGKPPINHPAMNRIYIGANAITVDEQTDAPATADPTTPPAVDAPGTVPSITDPEVRHEPAAALAAED